MKKAEFIDEISKKTGISKKEVSQVIEAAMQTITEALQKGDSVSFIGFGSFSVTKRAPRTTKIPGTNTTVEVPETKTVKFKTGKQLKEAVTNAPV